MRRKTLIGVLLAATGALFWGFSGPASEYLFTRGVTVPWLISSKMLIAGVVTMLLAIFVDGKAVLAPWQNRRDAWQMTLFIIFGMIAMQFVYFQAVAVANAPTATILQYLSPVVVLVVLAIKSKTMPARSDFLVIALAMFGTLMIVTKGELTQLAVTPAGLFWGIGAAFAAATYTLLPAGLLNRHSALSITAWAQLGGGLIMIVFEPFWLHVPKMDALDWSLYAFIVIGGTIIAYLIYLASLRFISPTTVSLLEAFEPLGATIVAVIFLGIKLTVAEIIGGIIILLTVFLMTQLGPKEIADEPADKTRK